MKTTGQRALFVLAFASLLAAGQAMATVVNFTADDGYANGDLTNNVDWATDASNGGLGGNIVSNSEVGYNGELGVVTMAGSADWVKGIYSEDMPIDAAEKMVTAKARFKYSTTGYLPNNINRGIFSLLLDDGSGGIVRTGVRRWTTNLGDPRILLFTHTAWSASQPSETTVGITTGTDESDWLELTITLVKHSASGTTDWSYSAILTNVTTGAEVTRYENIGGFAPNVASSASVRGAVSSTFDEASTFTDDRKMDRFEVISGVYVPPPPPPPVTTYDFSTGYVDGALAGQNGWVGASEHQITNGVLKLVHDLDWRQVWQAAGVEASSNNEYMVSAAFSFSELGAYNGFQKQFMNVQLNDAALAGTHFRLDFSRQNEDQYAVKLWPPTGGSLGYVAFTADLLGLDLGANVDLDSDLLELALTLRKGTTASDWTYILEVNNLDTARNVAVSTGITSVDVAMHTAATLFGGVNGGEAINSGMTNRCVSSVTIGSRKGDAIVEWGALGNGAVGPGDIGIVPATINHIPLAFGSYVAGNTLNPAVGAAYYPSAAGKSPEYNGASTTGPSTQGSVVDDATGVVGDVLQVGMFTNHFESMIGWETFLLTNKTQLTGIEMECKISGPVDAAEARWVIRKESGNWYASEAFSLLNVWGSAYAQAFYPAALTWYDFTPVTAGAATLGSEASIDMNNVDIVGFYATYDQTPATGVWRAIQTRYFRALGAESIATEPCPAPLLSIVLNGVNVDISWDSTDGCSYQLQTNDTLGINWGDYGSAVAGDGSTKTESIPAAGETLNVRAEVQ